MLRLNICSYRTCRPEVVVEVGAVVVAAVEAVPLVHQAAVASAVSGQELVAQVDRAAQAAEVRPPALAVALAAILLGAAVQVAARLVSIWHQRVRSSRSYSV